MTPKIMFMRESTEGFNPAVNGQSADLALARQILQDETLTFCAVHEGEITARDRAHGVVPGARLARHAPDCCRGAAVADRLVGRAAAILLAHLGVSAVYTAVLSRTAVPILEQAGIHYEYETLVDTIKNRTGADLCPMEKLAAPLEAADAETLLEGIIGFFEKQGVTIEAE